MSLNLRSLIGLPLTDDRVPTPAFVLDKTKLLANIHRAQKRAAEAVFAFTHELNEETRRIMRETQDPALAARAELSQRLRDPQINTLQEDLLSGKITWGEYNTARRALAEAVRSDLENE